MKYTRRKKRKYQKQALRWIGCAVLLLLIVVVIVRVGKCAQTGGSRSLDLIEDAPDYEVELLTVNPYSRPGISLDKVKGIVIHYTANPGSTAIQNRNYFEGLKDTQTTKASSHFIVGLDGEIVQCIPTAEISYASNDRNSDTISIECCHPDKDGKFNKKTYESLVHLTAWLCGKFQLSEEDVIRHYDVTGKPCPLYFVENEKAWEEFREDVVNYSEKYKSQQK